MCLFAVLITNAFNRTKTGINF